MKKTIFLKPTNDIIFRKIFISDQNCLESLLNAVFKNRGNIKVENVYAINSDIFPEYQKERMAILDVKAIDSQKRKFNIEMQVALEPNFLQRSHFYASRLYTEGLKRGSNFNLLNPAYVIIFCDFIFIKEKKYQNRFHSVYCYKEKYDNDILGQIIQQEIHYIELPKIKEKIPKDLITAWGLFFKNPNTIYKEKIMNMNEALQKAYKIVGDYGLDKKNIHEYKERQKQIQYYVSNLKEAEKKGIEQGIEKGIEKGIKKGIEQGIEKSKIEFAKKLLKEAFPIPKIAKLTALPEKEIKKLTKLSKNK